MKHRYQVLLAAVAGSGVGAFSCYLLMHKRMVSHYEALYEEVITEEYNRIKEDFENRANEESYMESLGDAEMHEIITDVVSKEYNIIKQDFENSTNEESLAGVKPEKVKYNKIKKEYIPDSKSTEDTIKDIMIERGLDPIEQEEVENVDNYVSNPEENLKNHDPEPKVIVIDEEEWADPVFAHFDKVTLTYYVVDGVLADGDDGDYMINNPEDIVGSSYEELDLPGSASSLYVRNFERSVDYEILRVDNSYTESVLGIMDYTHND